MRQSGFPVTLTTDFGYQDEYVGVMKGVILSINKGIPIVDLTHGIAPQDVRQAAQILWKNFSYFPNETVHLAIVDPGVGGSRRIIAVQHDSHILVGPDNGIFSPFFNGSVVIEVYVVENRKLFLKNVSTTFHGRDIMAPVAARLASGMAIAHVGQRTSIETCTIISMKDPVLQHNGVAGEIVSIDTFGNIRTNITRGHLARLNLDASPCITLNSYAIGLSQGSYETIDSRLPSAIINSSGELEICVKNGNAAQLLEARRCEQVFVRGHLPGCHGIEDGE